MSKKAAAEAEQEALDALHPRHRTHLLGHEAAEKHLLELYNAGRLPHALLVGGARGIGKATLAYRLARFLLSPKETGASLFGDALPPESLHVEAGAPTFKQIVSSSHPDLLVLEGEDIKIDQARGVVSFLALTPAQAQWRVVIIDSADAMNRNAANALLKTLEEPPPQAVLILVSHNPGSLLPTIRSRCRALRLLPPGELHFSRIMREIAPDILPGKLHAVSVLSKHAPGLGYWYYMQDAPSMYQEVLEFCASKPAGGKLHTFADGLARKDAQPQWQVFCAMLPLMINRVAACGAEPGEEVFPGEHRLLLQLRNAKPLDLWAELWEKSSSLLNDTNRLHLDRKQAVLTLMRALAE